MSTAVTPPSRGNVLALQAHYRCVGASRVMRSREGVGRILAPAEEKEATGPHPTVAVTRPDAGAWVSD